MMKTFERLVCEAAVTTLNMKPLCQSDADANKIIDELIEALIDYLSQFKK